MYAHGFGVVCAYWFSDGDPVGEGIPGVLEITLVVDCAVSTEETGTVSINLYIGP